MNSNNYTEKDEYVEFIISSSLYSDPDKNGKQKLIKKNITTKLSVYIDDIQGHEEIFNNKGKILPNICRIYHKSLGPLIVKSTYKQLSEIKYKQHEDLQSPSVGFKIPNKNGNKSK